MSTRSAACPGCGAEIVFRNAATLFVVCPSCGCASFRRDLKLEKIGKVAEVAPIDSPIALHATGRIDERRFTVVGQLQLDHGAGPWNEWCLLFDDGATGWLAEAQGQLLFTVAVDVAVAATWSQVAAGRAVDLGSHGSWIVAERGSGRLTAARGELASAALPGSVVHYADLSGPGDGFGTLDFGEGERCEAVYLGRRVGQDDLDLDVSATEAKPERKVGAERIACPKCGGAIDVRDPQNSVRVVCPFCSALLDASSRRARILGLAPKLASRPQLELGSKGRLFGGDYEVLAWIERSITADGTRWPWEEYLLRRADGEYRWLVCSQRHWSFVEPRNLASVERRGARVRCGGESFRHYSGGEARVDRVLGEVYWELAVGETVEVEDYVAPPFMVSFETTKEERLVSLGTYVTPDELKQAFPAVRGLLPPSDVGAQQPNRWLASAGGWWRAAGLLIASVLLLDLFFHLLHTPSDLLSADFPLERAVGQPSRGALVSDEFTLPGWRGVAEVAITAPGLDAGLFAVEGSLVESASGRLHDFALRTAAAPPALQELNEGGIPGTARVRVGELPGGRYRLRLEPYADEAAKGGFHVTVRSPIAADAMPIVVALLLALPPVLVVILGLRFEARRWAQSDEG
jgi:predicted RNA-binding Zn-ribbon protein involved in translation (DUF1610 family)